MVSFIINISCVKCKQVDNVTPQEGSSFNRWAGCVYVDEWGITAILWMRIEHLNSMRFNTAQEHGEVYDPLEYTE